MWKQRSEGGQVSDAAVMTDLSEQIHHEDPNWSRQVGESESEVDQKKGGTRKYKEEGQQVKTIKPRRGFLFIKLKKKKSKKKENDEA